MLIDLGDAREEPELTETPPGRVGHWWRRFNTRARRQRGYALALAALVLAAVGGAGVRVAPFRLAFTVPVGPRGAFAVGDTAMYALQVAPAGNRLRAYRLSDGALLWTVELPGSAGNEDVYRVMVAAGTVILSAGRAPNDLTGLTGYDPDTGTRRWELPGWVAGSIDGGRLLVRNPELGSCSDPPCDSTDTGSPLPEDLSAVDPVSGASVWQVRLSGFEVGKLSLDWYGPRLHRAALVDATNQLTVRDLATGAVTTGPRLPGNAEAYAVELVDDLVLVRYDTAELGVDLTAYEVGTLRPRWRTTIERSFGFASPCGPVVCLAGSSGTMGIDRANGTAVWRLPDRSITGQLAGGPLLAFPSNLASQNFVSLWVVDPATGLVNRTLPGWTVVDEASTVDQNPMVMRWTLKSGRTWFAAMSRDTGEIRILGSLARVWQGCQVVRHLTARMVACRSLQNDIQFWRVAAA